MKDFVYNGQPSRVVFGPGSLAHLEREIELLGAKRALVLSTPEQAAQAQMVADRLGNRATGIFPRAVMHVPIETAREARDEARRLGADCAIALGMARRLPWIQDCPFWPFPLLTQAAK